MTHPRAIDLFCASSLGVQPIKVFHLGEATGVNLLNEQPDFVAQLLGCHGALHCLMESSKFLSRALGVMKPVSS